MGCDIHIAIQVLNDGVWRHVQWQRAPYDHERDRVKIVYSNVPVAPNCFDARCYDLFGILANVRNGIGFAGIETGEAWPPLATGRGWPDGFDAATVPPDPRDGVDLSRIEPPAQPVARRLVNDVGPRAMGDHSFTYVTLDELEVFDWDGVIRRKRGVVTAAAYETLAAGAALTTYSGAVSGNGVVIYNPDEYREAKAAGVLAPHPYVLVAWRATARAATGNWPGVVLPWLHALAANRALRLVLGFDS